MKYGKGFYKKKRKTANENFQNGTRKTKCNDTVRHGNGVKFGRPTLISVLFISASLLTSYFQSKIQ